MSSRSDLIDMVSKKYNVSKEYANILSTEQLQEWLKDFKSVKSDEIKLPTVPEIPLNIKKNINKQTRVKHCNCSKIKK